MDPTDAEARSQKDVEENHQNADEMSAVDKIVRHVGSEPRLMYLVRWHGYNRADEAA